MRRRQRPRPARCAILAAMSAALDSKAERKILTVSELNRAARSLLERHFSLIWLAGEISNLARPASGHLYFSLKDTSAQVRCALFRNRARLLQAAPENGQQVVVRARISLYAVSYTHLTLPTIYSV